MTGYSFILIYYVSSGITCETWGRDEIFSRKV